MATWHTDYLLGNDTTGNGSSSLPYKTISKAYSVASASDTIKVAGSTLSDVPGLTLTSAGGTNYTYTANIDPTGLIAAGDCISLTDPEWGEDKFFHRVVSIVGTTVTLSCSSLPGIAMSVRKFDEIHYATSTTNTLFETGVIQPADIQLLGGWDSSFTTQSGYTVVRFQNTSTTSPSGTFINTGGVGTNTYRERFALFNLATGFAGGTGEEGYGDMIFVKLNSICGGNPKNLTNNVKWTIIWSDFQSGINSAINNDGTYYLTLNELYSIKTPQSNMGIRNYSFGVNNYYQQATISGGGDITTTNTGLFPSSLGGTCGDIYLNIIPSADNYIKIMPSSGNYLWNGRLIFPNNSCVLQDDGGLLVWNNPTQNVSSDFLWWCNGNSTIPTSNSGVIFAYDVEGHKASQLGSGLQFADTTTYLTGSNSLRSTRIGRAAGQSTQAMLNQFTINTGTTQVDITITAKNDSVSNITETFRIWTFGVSSSASPIPSGLITTQSLNNSWTTWTWTITDADLISYLTKTINVLTWGSSFDASSTYLWVDDVVITQS